MPSSVQYHIASSRPGERTPWNPRSIVPYAATIQDRSERKVRAAIDRLRSDAGTQKDHHRYPHLCSEIRQLCSQADDHATVRTTRSSSRSSTNTIKDLRVQIRDLKTELSQAQEQKIEPESCWMMFQPLRCRVELLEFSLFGRRDDSG